MQKGRLLFGLFAIMLAFCWGCATANAGDPAARQQKMEIFGRISVKGSNPHTYLCLTTDAGTDYRLEGELKDLIWGRYQRERIRLEGVVSKEAIGPGFPAMFMVHRIISK